MRRLTALSGFDAKGPACFLLEMGSSRLLLDLGEGPDHGRRPDLSGVGPVDAVLVSHAHHDHVGALDLKGQVGHPPVHATALTRDLAGLGPQVRSLPEAGRTQIAGLSVETGPCGHAPGAVWMRIGGADGLLYTGDCSAESTLYPHAAPPPAAALLFDASYAAYDDPLDGAAKALGDLSRQGPLLLPAPAAGRGLEMAIHFHRLGRQIALCPAHFGVAERLLAQASLGAVHSAELAAALKGARRLEADSDPGGVMIAAKPNAEGGVAAALAARLSSDGSARIVFTGHLAEGEPAHALVASRKASFRRWNVRPRLSEIRAILGRVNPSIAMPAFVKATGRGEIEAAIPDRRFASGPWMVW